MLFRAAVRQTAPLRRQAFTPIARRNVTTDAASSNVESPVPQEDDKLFTVRLSDESFETYELDPPPYTLETSKKELKQMYYDMVAMRYDNHSRCLCTGY
jgi:pyruvate dehydrogenase E1 component alpha subunit